MNKLYINITDIYISVMYAIHGMQNTRTYPCMQVSVCMHACMCVCVCVCVYTCMYVGVYVCLYDDY